MRLIDADELLKHAYDSGAWKDAETGFHQRVVDIEDIEDAPTVDPVKHGHWEWTDDPRTGDFVCSNCLDHNIVRSRYCPTCGAKMDGERRKDAETD